MEGGIKMQNLFDGKPDSLQPPAACVKDRCVLCGQETVYESQTPINQREFYIEGAGQLCRGCFRKIYLGKNE